ncbi:Kynurenine formamidase [Madurella mycetomatis]|uniref:Kynurenine formamidase n=1 Tax=Madurella mycetomatis TaxID=100816 RepID=A0A175W2S4_9PEZI|nr:Kynurenine formamidase [Madurella mycetomatis]
MLLTEADTAAWASVPWEPVTDKATGQAIGWHKAGVPYLPRGESLPLQTLDVWIPAHGADAATPPEACALPRNPARRWIIYLHGGAWCDPSIKSASFWRAAVRLLGRSRPSAAPSLEGFVSLNYRLSPHPAHPSPAPSRNARHPDHIRDVLAALAFVRRRLGSDTLSRSILAGHSCGATLAFQAVMSAARWRGPHPTPTTPTTTAAAAGGSSSNSSVDADDAPKPAVVVGFNGLYDLAGFIASPPRGYEGLREAYEEFTRGAFGGDARTWRAVCPTTAEGWVDEWVSAGGREVVLVQSRGDTLVPYEQLEGIRGYLEREGRVRVREMEAGGDHDDIWLDGERMAEILWEVAKGLE